MLVKFGASMFQVLKLKEATEFISDQVDSFKFVKVPPGGLDVHSSPPGGTRVPKSTWFHAARHNVLVKKKKKVKNG